MGDRTRGIFHKFVVSRTDGTSAPGGKHDGCFYFVLDCDHDPHAKAALRAYAKSCRAEYPALADDICNRLVDRVFGDGPAQETVTVPVLPISEVDEATVDALIARRLGAKP